MANGKPSFGVNIGWGQIIIAVRAYKATKEDKVSFKRIHAVDGGLSKQKNVCEVCGKELTGTDICKGYHTGNQMLKFTDDELDKLRPAASKNMSIVKFCSPHDVPYVALGEPYWLGTEESKRGGLARPFATLREGLRASGKVAVVRWVSRGNEHLGVLQADGRGFLLKELYFANEVKANDVEVLPAEIPAETVQKAAALIVKQAGPFSPEEYASIKPTYADALREIIERKAAGEEIKYEEIAPKTTDDMDAALDAMLG